MLADLVKADVDVIMNAHLFIPSLQKSAGCCYGNQLEAGAMCYRFFASTHPVYPDTVMGGGGGGGRGGVGDGGRGVERGGAGDSGADEAKGLIALCDRMHKYHWVADHNYSRLFV